MSSPGHRPEPAPPAEPPPPAEPAPPAEPGLPAQRSPRAERGLPAQRSPRAALRSHLTTTRLAGAVATSPRLTLRNCARLIEGEDGYTFGLSDWTSATMREAVAAVVALCGGDPGGADDLDGPGWIEPESTLAAIETHAERIAELAERGGSVLLATGHPTGLLPHYQAIARTLQVAGCRLLMPLDDAVLWRAADGGRRGVRYLDGVACVFDGARLLHSHRSAYMEALLDDVGDAADLVMADHGMAGAAIEAGLRTLSIADLNDPALLLAQARGRTDAVLPIDDNLAPRHFLPVTARMLAKVVGPDGEGNSGWSNLWPSRARPAHVRGD